MDSLVWEAPRVMNLREQDRPAPQPGEVLVRVAYAGICGSELSGYLGHNALRVPPLVMGHEFSGEVAGLGAGAAERQPGLAVGQRVTVNVTARNSGGDEAPPSVTQLFLSANTTLDEGDLALGDRAVPALAAGASSAASVELLIPAGTAAGRWYLLAKTDALNDIAEAVETNNVTARAIDISAP